jgi:putative acetyltransferase
MDNVSAKFMIRRYREGDHQGLMRFLQIAFSELDKQFLPDQKDSDIKNINDVYIWNRGSFHVIEVNGQICGSVGIRKYSEEVAELKRLYVSKECRGCGLGKALCVAAIEDAQDLGYRYLRLDTTFRSKVAFELFKKLGFQEIERYNSNLLAEIFMEKPLK